MRSPLTGQQRSGGLAVLLSGTASAAFLVLGLRVDLATTDPDAHRWAAGDADCGPSRFVADSGRRGLYVGCVGQTVGGRCINRSSVTSSEETTFHLSSVSQTLDQHYN